MHKQEKMSTDEVCQRFHERLARLKSVLGAKNDSELAGLLNIKQQSVSGAKKRCQMPASWLEEAGARGVSLDYIYFGQQPPMRKSSEDDGETQQGAEMEKVIAEQLVNLAISETGFTPSKSGRSIIERFVKRKVIVDAVSDVIEIVKDVVMSEGESDNESQSDND